jgi:hypothetical protein
MLRGSTRLRPVNDVFQKCVQISIGIARNGTLVGDETGKDSGNHPKPNRNVATDIIERHWRDL